MATYFLRCASKTRALTVGVSDLLWIVDLLLSSNITSFSTSSTVCLHKMILTLTLYFTKKQHFTLV